MSFSIFVDGSSNLPGQLLRELDICILPCTYSMNGNPSTYDGSLDSFDSHGYYDMLRRGGLVQTSLLNTQLFLDFFRPVLEQGKDVVYFSMSSGISGTCHAARIAAQELKPREAAPQTPEGEQRKPRRNNNYRRRKPKPQQPGGEQG